MQDKRSKFWPFFILLIWNLTIPVLGAYTAPSLEDLKTSLRSNDPAVRADVTEHFVISLGTVDGQSAMIPAVPVLIGALADPDAKVREFAISGLRGILLINSQMMYPSLSHAQNLTTNPSLQPALDKATNDADPEIRQLALEAYAVTYKLPPRLEDKIIAEFRSPQSELPHHESQRAALLESLIMSRSPSPKAVEFLTTLLDDPKWAPEIASMMFSDSCPLTDAALPKLVTLLSTDTHSVNREAYARAIASYGKKAEIYRPQLQAALANEKDDVARQNIQLALNKI